MKTIILTILFTLCMISISFADGSLIVFKQDGTEVHYYSSHNNDGVFISEDGRDYIRLNKDNPRERIKDDVRNDTRDNCRFDKLSDDEYFHPYEPYGSGKYGTKSDKLLEERRERVKMFYEY